MAEEKTKIKILVLSGLFFTLALLFAIILFSYDKDDGGYFSSGGKGDIHNILGVIGAWIADIILNLFGFIIIRVRVNLNLLYF